MYNYKRKLENINYISSKNKNTKKIENKTEDDTNSISTNKDFLSKKADDRKIERDCNHIYFYSEVDRESIYDLSVLIKESEEENILTSLKLNIPL